MRKVLLLVCLFAIACSHQPGPDTPAGGVTAEQMLVDRSVEAVRDMRANPDFKAMDALLPRAKGVLIFPRLIKAALIFGGEGGNGVLVARRPDGAWSAPAFYSLGAGSAGLQIGFQEASVVLLLMDDHTLSATVGGGLKLGADASIAAGTIGDTGSSSSANARGVVEFANVGGVFAGASLDGAVVASRSEFNQRYYGAGASTLDIVSGRYQHAGAAELAMVLAPRR